MTTDRRDFFSTVLALGATPALLQLLPEMAQAASAAPDASMDMDTYKFWTQTVRRPSVSFTQTGKLPLARGAEPSVMLYYSEKTGFLRAHDEQLITQMQPSGDVTVSVAMETLRPAAAHIKMMRENGSGSLRVDLRQAVPMHPLSDTLSWSSMGTIAGSATPGGIGYQNLSYDPKATWGASKLVPLVNGVGFWAWNMNVQPGQSKFAMMLAKIGNYLPGTSSKAKTEGKGEGNSGSTAPGGPTFTSSADSSSAPAATASTTPISGPVKEILGFVGVGLPSIAGTALHVVDAIYGFMQSQGGGKPDTVFEFQDQMMYATQDARHKYADPGVHLLPGEYVIVPSTSVRDLLGQKYKLLDSALVPSDTTDAQKDDALPTTLPDTPYATIRVALSPMSASCT
ncbi:MAG: hypothetical protein ABSE43_02985 [Steroidobacteraceae bacterium]|jgi:hypothetical protein